MKIIITGGAGFIGSHLAKRCVEYGHEVTVYDNFSTGKKENLGKHAKEIKIIRGDILDKNLLEKSFAHQEIVFHQAAQLEIFKAIDDPEYDLTVNTIGTLNVLKSARLQGVRKIVNASSACIYGQTSCLTEENYLPTPNWAYGVSKIAAEHYCRIYNNSDLQIASLRYGIVYGENEWYRRVLTVFIKRQVEGKPLVIFGNGNQIRDFIYVGDVVDMNILCMNSQVTDGVSINVGTGIKTTVSQLAKTVIKAGGGGRIVYENTPEGEFSKLIPDKRRNSHELGMMCLDISRARSLGWSPQTALIDGVTREIEWYRNHQKRWRVIKYSK